VDYLWATKSEYIGLIFLFVQLVFEIFNLCGPDPPTSQTYGQSDKQHAIARQRFRVMNSC